MTVVVAGAIAALLLASAWLLLTPLVVAGSVAGDLHDGVDADLRLRFAPLVLHVHGRRRVDVTVAGMRLPRRAGGAPRTTRRRASRGPDRWPVADLVRFAVRHRRALGVRRLDGEVRYGFEDPALTGQVHGLLSAARPLFEPPARLTLLADWSMQDVLAGRVDVELSVRIGRLGLPLAWLLLSRSARRRRARGRRPPAPGRSDTSRTASARAA